MTFQQTIRKLGYLTDQKGIRNRYLREQPNWKEHIDQTRQFIQSCIERHKPLSIAILGSGWLLDIPAEWLAQNSKTVYLIDVFHPEPAQQLQKKYNHVILLSLDLSGCAEQALHAGKKLTGKKRAFENIRPNIELKLPVDYMISVNLLDQLDTILLDYLRKKISISDWEACQFSQKVQAAHLQLLTKNNSSIVCSIKEKRLSMQHELKEENMLLQVKLPEKNAKRWSWLFDTNGSYYPKRKTVFEVMAMEL